MARRNGKFVFVKSKSGKTTKLHPTEKYIRERVREPEEFQPKTIRTIESGKHKLIIGRPKGKKTTAVQAILHPESLAQVKKEVRMRRQLEGIDTIEFAKEKKEHPWASPEQVAKIIEDHKRSEIEVGRMPYREVVKGVKEAGAEQDVEGFHVEPGKTILILKGQLGGIEEINPHYIAQDVLYAKLSDLRDQRHQVDMKIAVEEKIGERNKLWHERVRIDKEISKTTEQLGELETKNPSTQMGDAFKEIKKIKTEKKALEKEAEKLTEGELLVLAGRKNVEPIESEVYLKELEKRGPGTQLSLEQRKLYSCRICGLRIRGPKYSKDEDVYKRAHLQEMHGEWNYKDPAVVAGLFNEIEDKRVQ